jgi:hypothetical protein
MFEAVNENQTGCFGWELEQLFTSHSHTDEKSLDSKDQGLIRIGPAKHTCDHLHARHHGFLKAPRRTKPSRGNRTWHWLPTWHELTHHYLHELGFLGSLCEFVGAVIFYINCILALPGVYPHLSQGVLWGLYWLTYLVGGVLFIMSSAFYLLETQKKWYLPEPRVLGWWVGFWNMVGSVGWTLAAALGYCDLHVSRCVNDSSRSYT